MSDIRKQLVHTLGDFKIENKQLGEYYRGKVRDNYYSRFHSYCRLYVNENE